MGRVTITVSAELKDALGAYIRDQEAEPSMTAVVQAALTDFLGRRGYLPPSKPFHITPAPEPSGRSDISGNHDRHLAEATYKRSRSGLSPTRSF